MEKTKSKGKNLSYKSAPAQRPAMTTVTTVTKKGVTKKEVPSAAITPAVNSSELRYTEGKNKEKKRKTILAWGLITFAVLFLTFGFVAPYIFRNTDHWTYRYFVENTVNIRDIGEFFRDKLPVILQSIMVAVVFGIVINLVVWGIMRMSIRNKRTKTVAGMMGSFIRYIGYFIAIITILKVWGVNTTALLSGAAIFSAVIALGAQSLVSDILAGVFIVFENNFSVGDIITIEGIEGDFRGYVENIGVRTTQIRAELGEVMIIANSQMKKVINRSMYRCGVLVDVTVDHEADTDRIEKIINESIAGISERIPEATEGPTYLGIYTITENGVGLRFFAKCDESLRYRTGRRMIQEIKALFNKNKIKFAKDKIEVTNK